MKTEFESCQSLNKSLGKGMNSPFPVLYLIARYLEMYATDIFKDKRVGEEVLR